MPEGDTIHYAAARMREVLEGSVPEAILTPHPRHASDRWAERLAGQAVRSVDAHGKHLFVRFDGGLTVHSHLRMTGSWGIYRHGERWRRSAARAWLVIRGGGWEAVEFDGPVLELLSDSRVRRDPRLARQGQDVLGEGFDQASFLRRLRAEDPEPSDRGCAAQPAHGCGDWQCVEGRELLRLRRGSVADCGRYQ